MYSENFCLISKVYLKKIDSEIGLGLFAKKPIKKGSFIGEFTGIVRKRTQSLVNKNDYLMRYSLEKKKFVIDAEKKGNFSRFINHSFHPNLFVTSAFIDGLLHKVFIASRDILENEQLTFDYGKTYFKKAPKDL